MLLWVKITSRFSKSAVSAMSRIGQTFEPNPQAHQLYNELYQHVYSKMYHALRPLYFRIRDAVKYPSR